MVSTSGVGFSHAALNSMDSATLLSRLGDSPGSNGTTGAIARDVRFLFDDHFGLTRDAEFTDNALYLLLEDPTKNSPTHSVPLKTVQ